jgi:hypothetical protein
MSSTLEMTASSAEALAEQLLGAGRMVLEGLLVVEYRLATVAALVERFGSRHTERATIEMQSAIESLASAERQRQAALSSLAITLGIPVTATIGELVDAAPPNVHDALRELRGSMLSAKHRIEGLSERAEDVLGRRIALVAEVLASSAGPEPPTYGRELRPSPRFVDGLL